MKKMFIGAITCALILSSCNKNEIINGPDVIKGDMEIRLGAQQKTSTKGLTVNTIDQFKNAPNGEFSAIGVFSTPNTPGTPDPYFADGGAPLGITYGTTGWKYPAQETRPFYWPDQGKALDFFAYTSGGGATPDVIHAGGMNKLEILDYTPNSTVLDQKDFLVAVSAAQTKASVGATNGTLTLNFIHPLTKINVRGQVLTDDLEVTVGGVSITNVMGTADLLVDGDANGTLHWGNFSNNTSYAQNFDLNPILFDTNGDVEWLNEDDDARLEDVTMHPVANDNSFLTIPQSFTAADPLTAGWPNNGALLRIRAKIMSQGAWVVGDNTSWGVVYVPISSAATAPGFWAAGRSIVYTLTFGASSMGQAFDENGSPTWLPITLDADVAAWNETASIGLNPNLSAGDPDAFNADVAGWVSETNRKAVLLIGAPIMLEDELKITGDLTDDVVMNLTALSHCKMLIGSAIVINTSGVVLAGHNFSVDVTGFDMANWKAYLGVFDPANPPANPLVIDNPVYTAANHTYTYVRVGWDTEAHVLINLPGATGNDIFYIDGVGGVTTFDLDTKFPAVATGASVAAGAQVKVAFKNVVGVTFTATGDWSWNPLTNVATYTKP